MGTHLHLQYSLWEYESRAWRQGTAALESGQADQVIYVGHRSDGLPDMQQIAPNQTIWRVGVALAPAGLSRLRRVQSLPRWWRACQRDIDMRDVTLITAHSLAALPVAVCLKKTHGLPLLYDAHELESEREGWAGPIRRVARSVERWHIPKVDHTLVVSDSIRDWYVAAYPECPISLLRNTPVLPDKIAPSPLRARLGIPVEDLVYIYCGALGRGRGLEAMVKAFRDIPPDGTPERHLVLVGYGAIEEDLRAASADLPHVHMMSAVPQSDLISLLSGADVGIFVLDGTGLSYHYCLPNKVFEYSAAGLALLVGRGPELSRYAETYPAARQADPTSASISAAIREWDPVEIRVARPALDAFTPPSWQAEKVTLLDIYSQLTGVAPMTGAS